MLSAQSAHDPVRSGAASYALDLDPHSEASTWFLPSEASQRVAQSRVGEGILQNAQRGGDAKWRCAQFL